MSRTIDIDPVTRIEGHAKVHIEIGDNDQVDAAYFHIMEFRGFEKFVEGMQIELMPTLTTRICGTCPHAHHLVASKAVDKAFGVEPPRAALLLRDLLNVGSFIHSHGVHFFALAGPDLLLGIDAPAAKRNLMGLLEAAPDLAGKALRLRSLGSKIVEAIGGRGTHPVTSVAGGMAISLTPEKREALKKQAAEALELTKVAVAEGKKALVAKKELLSILPLATHNMGTVKEGTLDLYDGVLRTTRPDKSIALDMNVDDYRDYLYEEATKYSYSKQVFFKDPNGTAAAYRVGPLARLNVADNISTPLAAAELAQFKEKVGDPCNFTVMNHYARLIELLHCAERAVEILDDDEIISDNVKTKITNSPKPAIAHIEAPRGVLIHDFDVDENGIMKGANLLVATQHNISSINATVKAAAQHFMDKPEEEMLNGIEFAIRCYDPCLSCSTHQVGQMPLDVTITHSGEFVRKLTRHTR
jgi:coenzyme F420-reducing hydrogenase alpha subunit